MKPHLQVLDGFRGVAALCVVIFHLGELTHDPAKVLLGHAYLAVDFFFCLSGYVIGYAYDDRRDRMSIRQFFTARLIRLHPLVILGLLLGLVSYVLDPFAKAQVAPAWMLAASALGGALLVPTWGLPERWNAYLSLNSPSWSLMFEYIANIAFALLLWRLERRALATITAMAAAALVATAWYNGSLQTGWAWDTIQFGLVRVSFSFAMGLLLFRCGARLRSPFGFASLSAVLVALFLMPFGPYNWQFEAAAVVVAFPLIIAFGAGCETTSRMARACALLGRLSYPLYILHYPFVHVFGNYHWTHGFSPTILPWAIAGTTLFLVAFAYAALVLYDEPVRAWLRGRHRPAQPGALAASQLL